MYHGVTVIIVTYRINDASQGDTATPCDLSCLIRATADSLDVYNEITCDAILGASPEKDG